MILAQILYLDISCLAPCDPDTHVPYVTVIAGHIDESEHETHADKMPVYYIAHASTAGSCVFHSHVPDPLNGGFPRVTDMDLINSQEATSASIQET